MSRFVIALSKEQASFNFITVLIICSDFGAQEKKICHYFYSFPSICHEVMGPDAMILAFHFFFNVEFQASFFHSPLSSSSGGSLIPLHFLPL